MSRKRTVWGGSLAERTPLSLATRLRKGFAVGQTMVEYAMILSLIALALVGSVGGMAGQVGAKFNAISNTLGNGLVVNNGGHTTGNNNTPGNNPGATNPPANNNGNNQAGNNNLTTEGNGNVQLRPNTPAETPKPDATGNVGVTVSGNNASAKVTGGNASDWKYQWYENGKPIQGATNKDFSNMTTGKDYSVSVTSPSHKGTLKSNNMVTWQAPYTDPGYYTTATTYKTETTYTTETGYYQFSWSTGGVDPNTDIETDSFLGTCDVCGATTIVDVSGPRGTVDAPSPRYHCTKKVPHTTKVPVTEQVWHEGVSHPGYWHVVNNKY